MQLLEPNSDGNGFTSVGDEITLATSDLSGMTLAVGAQHTDQVSITPPLAGPYVHLRFVLSFEDGYQAYIAVGSSILRVAE